MCSSLVHVVLNLALIAAVLFMLVGVFSPQWTKLAVKSATNQTEAQVSSGLLITKCDSKASNLYSGWCKQTIKDLPDWQKAVFGCVLFAAFLGSIALLWSILLCLTCACTSCCEGALAWPIIILTIASSAISLIGLIVYAVNMFGNYHPASFSEARKSLGYSFVVAGVGTATMFVSIVLSFCFHKAAEVSPL